MTNCLHPFQESLQTEGSFREGDKREWGQNYKGEEKTISITGAGSPPFIFQSHIEYRKSWSGHVEQQDPHSLAKYLEMHNAYVGQIHNINGMIDYYYEECLPYLLQEFDDVYHDVAEVVLDSLSEGSKKITEKVWDLPVLFIGSIYISRQKIWPQGGKRHRKLSRQFLLKRSESRYKYCVPDGYWAVGCLWQ